MYVDALDVLFEAEDESGPRTSHPGSETKLVAMRSLLYISMIGAVDFRRCCMVSANADISPAEAVAHVGPRPRTPRSSALSPRLPVPPLSPSTSFDVSAMPRPWALAHSLHGRIPYVVQIWQGLGSFHFI